MLPPGYCSNVQDNRKKRDAHDPPLVLDEAEQFPRVLESELLFAASETGGARAHRASSSLSMIRSWRDRSVRNDDRPPFSPGR